MDDKYRTSEKTEADHNEYNIQVGPRTNSDMEGMDRNGFERLATQR